MESRYDDITQEVVLPADLAPKRTALTLQVVRGPRPGEVMTIDSDYAVLGRGEDADLRIEDPSLSRIHARFERDGESLTVTDLESRNGTLIDGMRIEGTHKLESGDMLTLGNVVVRFAVQDVAEVQASRDLYEAAVRDRLTGLYNRGYFDDRLSSEFSFVRRHRTSIAVLLVDLDHFKQVNDTYGHQVGDQVLQTTAVKIRESLRAEDLAARYGGEEFVVLARSTDVGGALVLGQRLRTRIGTATTETPHGPLRVTCSVGLAIMRKDVVYDSVAALLSAADEALYEAKRNGRNQVVISAAAQRATAERVDGSYAMKGAQEEQIRPRPKKRE